MADEKENKEGEGQIEDENKNLVNGDAENENGNPAPNSERATEDDKSKEGADKDGEGQDDDTDGEDEDNKDADKSDKELDVSVWGDTGDEVGNSVLQVMQNSGMKPEDAKALLYDPVQQGDPTKVDRDALVAKVGKANANLIMAGIENYVSKTKAAQQATLDAVYEVSGGKDQWDKVAPWIKANVPEAERQEYAAMLDKGGAQARFAAQELVAKYNADPKNTSIGKKKTIEGDGKAPDSGRAITRVQYAEELDKAHRTGASQSAIKEIQRARERGRKQGI